MVLVLASDNLNLEDTRVLNDTGVTSCLADAAVACVRTAAPDGAVLATLAVADEDAIIAALVLGALLLSESRCAAAHFFGGCL